MSANPIDRLSPPAHTVNLSVTYRCNLACPCCYQHREGSELDAAAMAELVDRLGHWGVTTLMLGGGEPLLRPDLAELVRRAKAGGLTVLVGSNGLLLSADRAAELGAAGLDLFFVGVDDPLGPGSKGEAAATPRRCVERLQIAGITPVANLIVTAPMLDHLTETLRRLQADGFGHVNLLRPRPDRAGTWFEAARLTARDLLRLQVERLEASRTLGMRLSLDCSLGPLIHGTLAAGSFSRRETLACRAGRDYFHIAPGGDAYPCPYLARPEFRIGNVADADFAERWRSAPVLVRLRDPDSRGEGCRDCSLVEVCGGCRALALDLAGDLYAGDPDCPFRTPDKVPRRHRLAVYRALAKRVYPRLLD